MEQDFHKRQITTLDEQIEQARKLLTTLGKSQNISVDQKEKSAQILRAKISVWEEKRNTFLKLLIARLKSR